MADIWTDLTDAIGKEMSISEMEKKYLNTYLVLVKEDGSEDIIHYRGYHEGFYQFDDSLGIRLKFSHETNQRIVCKFPERLMFNSGKIALEFLRLPNRQYRRGICKDTCRIVSPIRNLWNGDSHPWTAQHLMDALYPMYPESCESAIEQLQNKKYVSIALDKRFMLSQSITKESNRFYLWFSQDVIGYFEKDTFFLKHSMFQQEVLDNIHLFKPYGVAF